ncbi:uncharacterized protein [Drosophila pseudoobscura]|uniref:Uncharacterized protein n=1 Tax=Drosophila pseudoobscura pseudoobscura TaxID=46245 RepID=A0A6I8VX28_DROPS|nr:uncharacterized protein LOC117183949 [Drosophila pseudoobscura]
MVVGRGKDNSMKLSQSNGEPVTATRDAWQRVRSVGNLRTPDTTSSLNQASRDKRAVPRLKGLKKMKGEVLSLTFVSHKKQIIHSILAGLYSFFFVEASLIPEPQADKLD